MSEIKEVIVLGASGGFGTLFSKVPIILCTCARARARAAQTPCGVVRACLQLALSVRSLGAQVQKGLAAGLWGWLRCACFLRLHAVAKCLRLHGHRATRREEPAPAAVSGLTTRESTSAAHAHPPKHTHARARAHTHTHTSVAQVLAKSGVTVRGISRKGTPQASATFSDYLSADPCNPNEEVSSKTKPLN